MTTERRCRARKKRPAAPPDVVAGEEPVVTEALKEIRRKNSGLCYQCSFVRMDAAIDQSLEHAMRSWHE